MAVIRVTQLGVEQLSQLATAAIRATQDAVEQLQQPPGTQRLRVTQIAVEFPFPGGGPPPPPPPPSHGDIIPTVCEPPPAASCTTQPDVRTTNEPCEVLNGS